MNIKHILFIIVLFFCVAIILRSSSDRVVQKSSAVIAQSIPKFSEPSLFDPRHHLTRDLFMDHISILSVFSACLTCSSMQTELQHLKQKEKSVQIVGMTFQQSPSIVKKFLKKNNPYDAVIVDSNGDIAKKLKIKTAPVTFLVDKRGVIRAEIKGSFTSVIIDKQLMPLIHKLKKAW
jgi:cytochrome c biogenesis protein CcmG/thiol:disulfide interchange protein DsbE